MKQFTSSFGTSLAITTLIGVSLAVATACGGDTPNSDTDAATDVDLSDTMDVTETDVIDSDADLDTTDVTPTDTSDAETDTDADLDAPDSDVVDDSSDVEADVPPIEYPDPGFVYDGVVLAEAPSPDDGFLQETTTYYRTEERLPSVSAWSFAEYEGRLFVGTDSGIAEYDPVSDSFVSFTEAEPVTELQVNATGDLVGVQSQGLLVVQTGTGANGARALDGLRAATTEGIVVWGAIDAGIVNVVAPTRPIPGTEGWVVNGLYQGDSIIYAATDSGLYAIEDQSTITTLSSDRAIEVRACRGGIAVAFDDYLWTRAADGTETRVDPGPGALPTDQLTSVFCTDDWTSVGHMIGASVVAVDGSHTDYYMSERWVLDNHIRDVFVTDNGTRWFATEDGITRVSFEPWNYADKETAHQEMLDEHYWRLDGFVGANGDIPDPWSMDGLRLTDRDNDGLWTQMMIGGWAMAHEVTGDDFYCDEARRAHQNMLLQIAMPCISFEAEGLDCGFITRSFVRDDEGEIYDNKATQDNWHSVTYEGRDYYWKDDTSSDEYAGHFFGFPLYFDICATDEERLVIAESVSLAMDYIIANDYLLIDLDGEPTTHGQWDPDNVSSCVDGINNCDADFQTCASACFGGGFLNGAEILGALLATYHMTGEQRFYDEYERLHTTERYGEVLVVTEDIQTLFNPNIENHSDHELMMLAFHTLIRYEANEERRQQWMDALQGIYESETNERNPLWAAWTAGLTGFEFDRGAALHTLQELPIDRRQWAFDLTHRLDYEVIGRDRHGEWQFSAAPPYDEMSPWWWNGSPYQITRGGDGRGLQGPMPYMLAYWSLRFYGLLE